MLLHGLVYFFNEADYFYSNYLVSSIICSVVYSLLQLITKVYPISACFYEHCGDMNILHGLEFTSGCETHSLIAPIDVIRESASNDQSLDKYMYLSASTAEKNSECCIKIGMTFRLI